MRRVEKRALNAELFIKNTDDGRDRIRGARSVGGYRSAGIEFFVVGTYHHRINALAFSGRGYNNALRACVEMRLRLLAAREKAGRFDDDVDAHVLPWKLGRIFFLL